MAVGALYAHLAQMRTYVCSALQTLLSLGAVSSTGASVAELVAGSAGDGGGFAQYFAPAELGQLLEMERRAVVHAKASDLH